MPRGTGHTYPALRTPQKCAFWQPKQCARTGATSPQAQPTEDFMAKGQMRANKEKKKPKAEWN
jgi:hypothetical protein